mgnify:CR=1 FL=1
MSYSADALKKAYQSNYSKQRKKNLIDLREGIAKMSLTEFSKQTGIQKSNLSALENGDRELSLFNIQVYKTFFSDRYDLDISTDYLLGYSRNKYADENYQMISKVTGLSDSSIDCLKLIKSDDNGLGTLSTLNLLMSDYNRFSALLCNIDIMLEPTAFQTQGIVQSETILDDGNVYGEFTELTDNQYLAFVKKDKHGNEIGTLAIDSTVLVSHAYRKINELLLEYKKE